MADPRADLEKLHSALNEIAERSAADPAYRQSLRSDHVQELAAAGVSAYALTGALAEAGADEEEVAAFGMELISNPSRPDEGKLSKICIGTCKQQTIWLCGGCTNSTLTSGPINPQR